MGQPQDRARQKVRLEIWSCDEQLEKEVGGILGCDTNYDRDFAYICNTKSLTISVNNSLGYSQAKSQLLP